MKQNPKNKIQLNAIYKQNALNTKITVWLKMKSGKMDFSMWNINRIIS